VYDPLLERIEAEIAARKAAMVGRDDDEALRLENSLIDFVAAAWSSVDASEFQDNWAVEGLCEHLEALARGEIRKLLVNFPPRCSKTLVSSVCFPAWIWAKRERTALTGPQVKFICGSYGHSLSLMNSNLCRRLILSPFYQERFGHRFALRDDQNNRWQVWDPADGKFPMLDLVVASVDGAFTEDELNDPSAMSVWGTFWHPELRAKRVIVLDAWRKHLPLHGAETQRRPEEIPLAGDTTQDVDIKNAHYRQRVSPKWGLVEWIRHTCMRFRVDLLLVEKAATGITVAQELQRLYSTDEILVHLIPPKGDKVSRALAIQPLLAGGLVFAPKRSWADDLLIKEMSEFPLGKRDDLTDTTSQALGYLRQTGRIRTDEEVRAAMADDVRHRAHRGRLYAV
jgi:predicted phage terminase large subunit-like protein